MTKLKITIVLYYIFLFTFLLYNSQNYLDPDLGWHIEIGKQIISEKSLPKIEKINFPILGEEYIDHEWLANAFIYITYEKLGYFWINLFFVLIIFLTFIILNHFLLNISNLAFSEFLLIIFLELLGVFAMAPHLGIRIQEITLLNILMLFLILNNYIKYKKVKILFFLFPLFYFWSCVHGGFLIGFFLLFCFAAIKIMEYFAYKISKLSFIDYSKKLSAKELINFIYCALLSIIITFFTPYGIKLYDLLKDYKNSYYMMHINEWLPAWRFPISYYQMVYMAISVIIFFLIIQTISNKNDFGNKKYKINLFFLLTASLFFILAFKSKRHFPLFFFASFTFFINFLFLYLRLDKIQFIFLRTNNKISKFLSNNLISIFISAIFIASSWFLLMRMEFPLDPFASQKFCQNFPCGAINYLKNSKYSGHNLFNVFGWGGYIIKAWPEKKLFIDGRQPQRLLNGKTFLEEYFEFAKENKQAGMIQKYNIEAFLLMAQKPAKFNKIEKFAFGMNEEKENSKTNYLLEYLEKNENWKIIYSDQLAQIFVKN